MTLLRTQQAVTDARKEFRDANEAVERATRVLDQAIAAHRTQISRSLTSRDPTEREMAERVAEFWEVPVPVRG